MNNVILAFQGFITAYRSRSVPPPHILLVGHDDDRNASVAFDFANNLGVKFVPKDAGSIQIIGDLTAILWGNNVAFLSNIHRLKKPFAEKLERDLRLGEWEVVIGQGSAARTHKMDMSQMVLVGTCPTKYDCPSQLLKLFETVLSVEPPTNVELVAMLEQEAWKDRISLDPDAADLLLRASGGRSDLMLTQFRRVCGVIEPLKYSNKPQLTSHEVANALERLRIKIPPVVSPKALFNLQALSGQEFELVIKSLLVEMGFQAELTEITGDGGIDIIASLDKPFIGGRYLFQCKRYADNNLVGAPEIRDFYGAVMADRAMKGIFITTSDFTTQAKDFAAQSGIELVNRSKLLQLFEDNGLTQ
jgi:hypothetical protein